MTDWIELADHLFRHEAGRMVSSLVRILGLCQLALAEDAVQDALLRALDTWRFGELPRNPAAWLMRCARNRALDLLRRQGVSARVERELSEAAEAPDTVEETSAAAWPDDELRLMFSCCAPELSPASQVAVILKYLCGFAVREIAQAFLSTEAAVEKQLYRARTVLEQGGSLYDVADADQVRERLPSVRRPCTCSSTKGSRAATRSRPSARTCVARPCGWDCSWRGCPRQPAPRRRPCSRSSASTPPGSARGWPRTATCSCSPSRTGRAGTRELVSEGVRRLAASAEGSRLGAWHLEAAIAAQHALAPSFEATDWTTIRRLYDLLLAARPSPVVALNRAIAVGMAEGPEAGLRALSDIEDRDRLARHPFLDAAVAEFELRSGRPEHAARALRAALGAARNPAERALLARKLAACGPLPD